VRQFMMTDCDVLVFLDADVGWQPEALVELIGYPRCVVGGIYPLKDDTEGYPIQVPELTELWSDELGLVEVKGLPTGFMKIQREVIQKIQDELKPPVYWGREDDRGTIPHHIFFERTFEEGIRYSGDYSFCRKWEKVGGKLYTNPRWFFTHHGGKEWAGDIGHYWRREFGVIDQEWIEAVDRVRDGTNTPEDFVTYTESWGNHPWRVDNDLLDTWMGLCRNATTPILECGSGLTSILGAAATGENYYALEHNPGWAAKVKMEAERLGLTNLHIVLSPLENRWYTTTGLENLGLGGNSFKLILVDGPPEALGNRARVMDAVDMRNATVVWDDTAPDKAGFMVAECARRGYGEVRQFKNGDYKHWSIVSPKPSADLSEAG